MRTPVPVAGDQPRPQGWRVPPSVVLVVLAAATGLITGLVTATFRRTLEVASTGRLQFAHWTRAHPWLGVPAYLLMASLGAGLAAWLVQRVEPHTEGSGIPRVEGIVSGRIPPGRLRILPVKFFGGVLSIGSGLALGREGPSVQMGANVATLVSRASGLSRREADGHATRVLVASGAGAALSTAFAAPLAGSIFILEELVKKFDHRVALAALVASGSGMAAARLIIGPGTDFAVPALHTPLLRQAPLVAAVGLLTGLAGVLYNRFVIACLRRADTSRVPMVARAMGIGLSVGCVGLLAPELVGGGNNLTQPALWGQGTLTAVVMLLAVRFVLGAVSYAACTPGGLFAPSLVLGSHLGLLVALVGQRLVPALTPEAAALALVGMASFLAATVRAPVTGIVLASEMTGSAVLLAPMLGASAVAMLVALLMGEKPIYDQLSERSAWRARVNQLVEEGHGRAQPSHTGGKTARGR